MNNKKFERQLADIMKNDGDRCSLCRRPFGHNVFLLSGLTKRKQVALVGKCCELELQEIRGFSFYTSMPHQH